VQNHEGLPPLFTPPPVWIVVNCTWFYWFEQQTHVIGYSACLRLFIIYIQIGLYRRVRVVCVMHHCVHAFSHCIVEIQSEIHNVLEMNYIEPGLQYRCEAKQFYGQT